MFYSLVFFSPWLYKMTPDSHLFLLPIKSLHLPKVRLVIMTESLKQKLNNSNIGILRY